MFECLSCNLEFFAVRHSTGSTMSFLVVPEKLSESHFNQVHQKMQDELPGWNVALLGLLVTATSQFQSWIMEQSELDTKSDTQ